MTTVDVNTGGYVGPRNLEETIYRTNLEAAVAIARQLRIRNLGGIIIIDFIDMEENRNNRAVEKKLKECLKADRARIQVGRISHFGLLEMSRQRMRASVMESTMTVCPHCEGTGHVRSVQSVALHMLRAMESHLQRNARHNLTARTTPDAAFYVLNNKRETLLMLEKRYGVQIGIEIDHELGSDPYRIEKGEQSLEQGDPSAGLDSVSGYKEDPELIAADEAAFAQFEKHNREIEEDADGADEAEDKNAESKSANRKRKRRRRRRGSGDDNGDIAQATSDAAPETANESNGDDDNGDEERRSRNGNNKRNRRRSRGRRGGRNRRIRTTNIPAAEPVGPLADLMAEQNAEDSADDHAPSGDSATTKNEDGNAQKPAGPVNQSDSEHAPSDTDLKGNGVAAASTTDSSAIAEPTTGEITSTAREPTPQDGLQNPEKAPPAPVNDDSPEKGNDEPGRFRATASTLDLDVKPVVSSTSENATKPKRGWWSRK